ncbi:hypothetical protein D3C87_772770 [compost metagenome]
MDQGFVSMFFDFLFVCYNSSVIKLRMKASSIDPIPTISIGSTLSKSLGFLGRAYTMAVKIVIENKIRKTLFPPPVSSSFLHLRSR